MIFITSYILIAAPLRNTTAQYISNAAQKKKNKKEKDTSHSYWIADTMLCQRS